MSKLIFISILVLNLISCDYYSKDYSGLSAYDKNGNIYVVVENTKGDTRDIVYDTKAKAYHVKGQVEFPHPTNTGFIPSTINSSQGPLDVLIYSKELEKGQTLSTKPIGILKYKLENVIQFKIVVIPIVEEFVLDPIKDFEDFSSQNLELRKQLSKWVLQSYTAGDIQLLGWYDEDEALSVIEHYRIRA